MKSFYVFGNINPLARDVLNNFDGELKLKKQFAQKSLMIFNDKGMELSKKQVVFSGTWGEYQAYDELTKCYRNEILNNPADYLIIDALGSVIPIYSVLYKDESYNITYSEHVKNVIEKMMKKNKMAINLEDRINCRDIIRRTTNFCNEITGVYEQSRIIVHEANYPKFYLKEGEVIQYSNEAINSRSENQEMLRLIYDCMKEFMPAAHYISMLPEACAKSEKQYSAYDSIYMQYLTASVLLYIDAKLAQSYIKSVYSN